MRPHLRLSGLATDQDGVVATRQLEELGYSESMIRRAVASGRLLTVHRGVYAVGHRRLSRRGRCLAATLACGSDAMVSHRSAAWLGVSGRRSPPGSTSLPLLEGTGEAES